MKLKTVKPVITEPAMKTPKATKVVKVASPVTPGEPKPKAEPKAREASKFVSGELIDGRRMRVSEYQDHTFATNDTRRLTDEELAADWRRVFPLAVAFTPFHVRGARRDFVKGKHSKAFPGAHTSAPWFVAADGKRTQATPKASTAQVTPAEPKAPAASAKPVVKPAVAKTRKLAKAS